MPIGFAHILLLLGSSAQPRSQRTDSDSSLAHCTSGECTGVLFVHVGKSAGGVVMGALRHHACARGQLFDTVLELHGCGLKYEEWPAEGRCTAAIAEGFLAESVEDSDVCEFERISQSVHPSAKLTPPAAFSILMRQLDIVLWLRDPVSRFISCFNFVALWWRLPSEPVRRAYNHNLLLFASRVEKELGLSSWRAQVNLELVIAKLSRASGRKALRIFAPIPHAMVSLARYVRGVRGLERNKHRLLFVGRTEQMQTDLDGLRHALAERFGAGRGAAGAESTHLPAALAHPWRPPPRDTRQKLGRTHRRLLSNRAIAYVRALFDEDFRSIAWLEEHGFVQPTQYTREARDTDGRREGEGPHPYAFEIQPRRNMSDFF